ncbi:hypothetical protein [Rhizobium sp. NXC24]|uniref:hypothetical protein n=1 Tax=Rhizobium sp. NXC24 TaxID=2048897 RepID=UPI00131A4E38|nr:hypothetical protein [Rhizobium sp. NXC24]
MTLRLMRSLRRAAGNLSAVHPPMKPFRGGEMDRQPQARHRMMIFVAAIFIIACCIAAYFAVNIHPGAPVPGAGRATSPKGP